MKTVIRSLGIALLLSALACAGKPTVNFAYDKSASFAGLKTYAWYDDPNFQMPGGFSGRENGASRDTNKRVQHVPAAIDVGYLVGKKFDDVHNARHRDHGRVRQDFKIGR